MDIGTQLRNLIDQEGITQKQLAEELNISTATLNGYIQNRRQPDAKMAIRLASYFDTTIDYIYGLSTFKEPLAVPMNAEEKADKYLPGDSRRAETFVPGNGKVIFQNGKKKGEGTAKDT